MFGAQKPLNTAIRWKRRQKPLRDLLRQNPRPVLRKRRGVLDRIIEPKPDEPAKLKIEIEPLHQLPLGADRIEQLQQDRPQKPLWRDRWAATFLVKHRKPRIERNQRRGHQSASPEEDAPSARAPPDRRRESREGTSSAPRIKPQPITTTASNQHSSQKTRVFSAAC
jgi:hypothetical protein